MIGWIGRPRTPPASLISSMASNVPCNCEISDTDVMPDREKSHADLPAFHVDVLSPASSLTSEATVSSQRRPALTSFGLNTETQ